MSSNSSDALSINVSKLMLVSMLLKKFGLKVTPNNDEMRKGWTRNKLKQWFIIERGDDCRAFIYLYVWCPLFKLIMDTPQERKKILDRELSKI